MIISCPLALAQMFESMKPRAAFKIRSEVSMNSSADLERPHFVTKGEGTTKGQSKQAAWNRSSYPEMLCSKGALKARSQCIAGSGVSDASYIDLYGCICLYIFHPIENGMMVLIDWLKHQPEIAPTCREAEGNLSGKRLN